jgi:CHAD domain-containing protein
MDERMPDSTTPVPAALARHLAAEWRRLRRAWSAAQAGDAAAVRRVRIATRRLREGLAVAERAGVRARATGSGTRGPRHASRARRALRRVRRALGPVREIAVSLETFDDACARHAWNAELVAPIRRAIERTARRRRAALDAWMDTYDRAALARRVSAATEGLAAASAAATEQTLAALLLRRAREVRHAAAPCGTLYDPERLHALRIAAKKLRYGLELGAAAGLDVAPAMAALIDIQGQLGRLHDIQVLQQTVQEALAARRGAPPAAAGAIVLDALERDCRWLHAAVVGDMAGLEAALAAARRAVVPRASARPRRASAGNAAAPDEGRPARGASRRAGGGAARMDTIGY